MGKARVDGPLFKEGLPIPKPLQSAKMTISSSLLTGYVTASMTALTLRMRGTAVSFSQVEEEKLKVEKETAADACCQFSSLPQRCAPLTSGSVRGERVYQRPPGEPSRCPCGGCLGVGRFPFLTEKLLA